MNKENFQTLVTHFTSLNREDAPRLLSLKENYPYSQVIHNLCSRVAQDLQLENREQLLHQSAIYATERTVLKSLLQAPRADVQSKESGIPDLNELNAATIAPIPEVVMKVVKEDKDPEHKTKEKAIVLPEKPAVEEASMELKGEALIADLFLEMDKLKITRQKFQASLLAFDEVSVVGQEAIKKARKIVPEEPTDVLIEEIKTKKKVKPDGPHQKEQIEIIENFIKTQPTIAKNKLNTPPSDRSDLAEKSLLYGDSIVSETLVEILIKQGKKEKAIEVLKKLIWKFPQKKAYFAARIEDLKK